MRDNQPTNRKVKIELLNQWKLEAESRKNVQKWGMCILTQKISQDKIHCGLCSTCLKSLCTAESAVILVIESIITEYVLVGVIITNNVQNTKSVIN